MLVNICRVVPGGVVVFLPSYSYCQHLTTTLTTSGVMDTISTKKKVSSPVTTNIMAGIGGERRVSSLLT